MSLPLALSLPLIALAATPLSAPRTGPAEAAFWQCWDREVNAPCVTEGARGDALEACRAERSKTTCVAEKVACERELAAGIADDALELLGASIKQVCAAEDAAVSRGRVAPEVEEAIAAGWREALEVRSEFMKACERSGSDARQCDDRANEAERRARSEFCTR